MENQPNNKIPFLLISLVGAFLLGGLLIFTLINQTPAENPQPIEPAPPVNSDPDLDLGSNPDPDPDPGSDPDPGPGPKPTLPDNWSTLNRDQRLKLWQDMSETQRTALWDQLTATQKTDLNPFNCDIDTQIIWASDGSCHNKYGLETPLTYSFDDGLEIKMTTELNCRPLLEIYEELSSYGREKLIKAFLDYYGLSWELTPEASKERFLDRAQHYDSCDFKVILENIGSDYTPEIGVLYGQACETWIKVIYVDLFETNGTRRRPFNSSLYGVLFPIASSRPFNPSLYGVSFPVALSCVHYSQYPVVETGESEYYRFSWIKAQEDSSDFRGQGQVERVKFSIKTLRQTIDNVEINIPN